MSEISIFGKVIPTYGLMCFLGIAAAAVVAVMLAKKQKIDFYDFVETAIITLICAGIGAKLLFVIVSWNSIIEMFKNNSFWASLEAIIKGGFVFYGGLIGGAIGLFLTLKIKKQPILKTVNIYAVVLTLGHAFGRIGCFMAGCCYGMEYNGFLSFTYKSAMDLSTPIGVPLLPIQLIEAFALFALFAILLVAYLKMAKHRNMVCLIYAFGYSIIRFTLEFFRGDKERGLFLNLSTSQWISILIFVVATSLMVKYIYTIIKNKKEKVLEEKTQQ